VVYFVSRLLYWFCLGLILLYITKVEKQHLLLWQEKKYSVMVYVLSVIAVIAAIFIGIVLFQLLVMLVKGKEQSATMAQLIALLKTNMPLLFFTVITAGVTEEFIFRGYIQPRLQLLFKSPFLAIFISSLLFGLMHYKYGTIMQVAGPFVIGLVFSIYYWKFRNIKVIIFCHALWDLLAIFSLIYRH